MEFFLDVNIKRMEIEIPKELTRQIPNRKSLARWSKEETLCLRESYPVSPVSPNPDILGRIVENDFLTERKKNIPFIKNGILVIQEPMNSFEEQSSVDTHEK